MSQPGRGRGQRGGGGYDNPRGGGEYRGRGGRGYDNQGRGGGGYDNRGRGGGGYDNQGRGGGGYDNRGRGGYENRGRGYDNRGGGAPRGGHDGGRGGFRGGPGGGRGGFGGPKPYDDAQPIIQYVQNRLPINTAPDYARLKKEYGLGWHDLPEDLNDVQVQKYNKAPATKFKEKIDLSVNWFPLQKFKVPERIFHYEVTIERVKEPKKDAPNPKPTKVEKKGQGTRAEAAQGEAPQQRRLPKPLPQLILQRVISEIKRTKNFHGIVSDLSNNVYASRQLESLGIDLIQTVRFKDLDQEILQEDDDGSVKVTLARTDLDVDPGSLRALNEHLAQYGTWKGYDMDVSVRTVVEQVYSAFVKSLPPYRFIPVGKSNLVRWSGEESSLGDNVVCWKGLSANISMGWKPYLNVNVEHCPFLEGKNIVDAIASLMRFNGSPVDIRNWRQWQFREATSLLKNIKVWYVAGGRKFSGPIFSVLQTSIGQTMFPYNDRTISVRDYFQQVYRENLDAGHICLALRGGRAQVPAELCTIKLGQSYNRKLNEQQTSKMLVVAKKNPDVLHKEIMDQVGNLALSGPVADDWGVNVSKDMLRLKDARVLKPPQLFYGEAIGMNQGKGLAVITPQDGSWSINQASFKFFEPVSITEWGILVANCNIHDLSNFRRLLIRNGVDNGVIFQNQNPTEEYIGGLEDVKDNFEKSRSNVEKLRKCFENFKAKKCQIVFVIVPKKNSAIYCHVKQAAELGPDSKGLGVLTQCVVALNVDKGQPATINNILLKVNSKLGGKNYIMRPPEPIKEYFNLIDCPTLIMGADVMHPPPGAGRKIMVDGKEVLLPSPSFAAVTGSLDRTGMPFMMDIKAQMKAGRGAAEVIQGLGESVMKLLQGFRAKSRLIPRKIIYFRDGVGEGQFPELLHIELRAIRNVCETLKDHDGEPYRPKITFVTVQKRHKTRFFYHSPRGIINAPAGTVVDREIVHQVHDDFYLLSHKGMMGTSRPTHYRVLWDDSDFTADEIQHLTYYLCYMYVRCRKSVKIPAPTYYAHWAAARAKALADGMELQFNTPEELTAYMKRHPDLMKNAPMHFV